MSTNPIVSVLITSYNYGHYISEAIDSVLAQTYTDFELIIVDNGSEDDTAEIVKTYMLRDSRVKIHINESNIGMFRNYNKALLLARGKYIKFLNADDTFHPELLETFTQILNNDSNISLVTSYRQHFQGSDELLKQNISGLQNRKEMIIKGLLEGNFIGEPTTVMFRRDNLTVGLFDTSLLMVADHDM